MSSPAMTVGGVAVLMISRSDSWVTLKEPSSSPFGAISCGVDALAKSLIIVSSANDGNARIGTLIATDSVGAIEAIVQWSVVSSVPGVFSSAGSSAKPVGGSAVAGPL